MAAISAGDKTLLREKKETQHSTERLYGFGYPAMWKGRLNNASIARGDQTIVADTGAMESGYVFANLVADLLLFVGSAEGLSDKGRRRILSVSGTAAAPTFIVDWNDDVDWANDDYLTVVNFYSPWPRHQWFTSSPIDFRVDGPPSSLGGLGVDYSDQGEQPPPLVVMGSNYAGELVSGTLAVQLSAANSQAVADGATISSYAWAAVPTAGASFDNAALAAPTITFTADNSKYQISCTVTDSNAKTSIAYRAYIIGGAITEFSRGTITENYDKESVSCSITLTSPETTESAAIRPVMTWADFAEKTLVIITSEDHYGSTQKTITFRDEAQYTDHGHILFCGYLFSENDDLVDDGSGTVSLTAVSTIPMFLYSLSITGVEDADEWFEMNKELMTVAGNIFHLFKYHSTLLDIMDWRLPWSDTVKRSANEEFGEGAILGRAQSLIASRLMAMTATAQGEIWIETDLNLRNSTDRTAETTTLILTDDDIEGTKRARRRHYGDQIRTLLDGGSSTGLLGSFTPFLSASQNIASAEGRPQMVNFSRIMLPDQTEANRLAGRISTVANSEYQEANLELSGNYRSVFSPGDQQKVDLGDVFAGSLLANIRGYTNLEDVNVIVRSVSNKHDNGFTSVSIVADIIPDEGLTGVTLPFPAVPPDATVPGSGAGSGSFDEPDPPQYPPVPPNLAVAGAAVGVDEDDGIYWTADSGGEWEARNNGLATANGLYLIWDPWWKTAFGNNSSNPEDVILWWCGTGFIRRSLDAGTTWEDLTPNITDPPNTWSDVTAPTVADLDFIQVHGNIHTNQQFVFLGTITTATAERAWVLKTADNGVIWTWQPNFRVGGICPQTWSFEDSGEGWTFTDSNSTGTASAVGAWSSGNEAWQLTMTPVGGTAWGTIYLDDLAISVGIGDTVEFDFSVPDDSGNTSLLVKAIYDDMSSYTATADTSGSGTRTLTITVAGTIERIECWSGRQVGGGVYTQDIEEVRVVCAASQAMPDTQAVGIDIDNEDGTKAWVTNWDSNDQLNLLRYIPSTLEQIGGGISLGAATKAQFDARTFIAWPFVVGFDNDNLFVFGRMNAPQGLANPEHIIFTTDGGDNWSSVGDSATWGADYVGAFFATDTSNLFAFVNGASRALFQSINGGTSWSNLSSLPFDVDPGAVSLHPDGRILIANRAAGAQMVAYSDSPYSSWTNATGSPSFPVSGGGARAIIWVV